MRRINPAALRQRFRRALKGDKVRSIGMMFHVKHSSFRTAAPIVPLFFAILRSLRRRISARGGWLALKLGDSSLTLRMTNWRRNETVSVRSDGKGQRVSRETKTCQSELSGSALTVFVRMVLSAYGYESVNPREDAGTGFDSAMRVLCPMRANARLNLRRRPRNLFRARVQLHAEDRARLTSCLGSSGLNPYKCARMRNRFLNQKRASPESQRSAPT